MAAPDPVNSSSWTSALAASLFGLFLTIFGAYLIYDKVLLSLRTGVAYERIGRIERASEPGFFWSSVGFFGFFGLLIAAAGTLFLIKSLKSFKATKSPDTRD